MNHIYVIYDEREKHVCSAALEESMAIHLCKKLHATTGDRMLYRAVRFFYEEGTEINIIAPPIPKEYLPSDTESSCSHEWDYKKMEDGSPLGKVCKKCGYGV